MNTNQVSISIAPAKIHPSSIVLAGAIQRRGPELSRSLHHGGQKDLTFISSSPLRRAQLS